ncbi:MAG: GTP pyrophosphokinase family protein [Firmicutes bacterium]|nr:GTP pyrophosphokinase family protein [Bacillota bacterium]
MSKRTWEELENKAKALSFSAEDVAKLYLEYSRLTKNYSAAIREVQTKLQILDEDFEMMHDHDPIHHMESRVKSMESILGKMERKGLDLSLESIVENLTDIAGVRVICHYVDDIYEVAHLLKSHADVEVIKETDYIKNPKPNGYRSLHLVVKIPVYFVDGVVKMPVEIQIRTMAMNFWASLEHKLRYKSNGAIPGFIANELKECSETIAETDLKMQRIHSFLQDIEHNVIL